MDETNTPKDPVVVEAAHRFPNAHDVPVVDKSTPADIVPIHDAAQIRANENAESFVDSLGNHLHMKAIDEAIERASDSEPVESTPEQRKAATKALMRFSGLSGDPKKELDESVSSHPAAHKPKFARELPDRGRTIADNRRRQNKYGNH